VNNLKVTENVYALDSTKGNYAYIIRNKEIILIDTGLPWEGKSLLKELKSLKIKPEDIKNILITHHDVDHVGNLSLIEKESNANIWASKEDIPYICGNKKRHGLKKYIPYIIKIKKPGKIQKYSENHRVGDIEVIPTPGHTPGHVCLLYKDVLFVGDLLRTSKGNLEPMKSFMNWNTSILNESIKKLNDLNFKWICPAHGEPVQKDSVDINSE